MSASIRVAVSADAGEIAELGNQLGYDLGTPETAERIRRVLARNDQLVFVAEVNRVIVGWVHAFVLIGGLVVDKNHRRQGIAGMLMASAEQWARERGCFVVRLTSSSTRTAAHRFYERIGYEHIKTQYAFVKALDVAPRKDNSERPGRWESGCSVRVNGGDSYQTSKTESIGPTNPPIYQSANLRICEFLVSQPPHLLFLFDLGDPALVEERQFTAEPFDLSALILEIVGRLVQDARTG